VVVPDPQISTSRQTWLCTVSDDFISEEEGEEEEEEEEEEERKTNVTAMTLNGADDEERTRSREVEDPR